MDTETIVKLPSMNQLVNIFNKLGLQEFDAKTNFSQNHANTLVNAHDIDTIIRQALKQYANRVSLFMHRRVNIYFFILVTTILQSSDIQDQK